MKRTLIMLVALMFGATAITASAATTTDDLPGLAPQPASYFYTGKPYDADLGAYVFTFRNYDPELNRWTTPDPSGFPDGANNRLYAPIPTTQYDLLGLAKPGASTLWNNYPDYSSFDATMTYELVGGWLLESTWLVMTITNNLAHYALVLLSIGATVMKFHRVPTEHSYAATIATFWVPRRWEHT